MSGIKLTPPVILDPNTNRAIKEIYSNLNKLLISLDPDSHIHSNNVLDGFVKAVYDTSEHRFKLKGKTSHGWASIAAQKDSPTSSSSLFYIKENGKTFFKNTLSILGSRTTSSSTGALELSSNAIKTTNGSLVVTSDNNYTVNSTGYIQFDPGDDEKVWVDINNSTRTTTGNSEGFEIDYDYTGIAASGQAVSNKAINVMMNCGDTTTQVGALLNYGFYNTMVGGTSGTQTNFGIYNRISGADTNIGLHSLVPDGELDIQCVSSADNDDYFGISVSANGATTLSTVDDDGTAANLTLDVDGDISLDADGGEVYLKDGGTTFGTFTTEGTRTSLYLYENAGASADDYFNILVGGSGATTLSTVDAGGQTGNMLLAPDGYLEFRAANNEAVIVDANCTNTTTSTNEGLEIDYDHTGISASGQNVGNRALQIALNSDSPTHVGAITNYAIFSSVAAGTSGTQTSYGLYNRVTGADNNTGIYNYITDGGEDIRMVSSANTSDYCTISTTTNGATTIATVDADAEAADFTLDIDGDITLDADGSQVNFSNNGVLAAIINTANGRITQYGTAGSTDDYSQIATTTNGAMSITTVDAAGANADLAVNIDGDITLNSGTGVFIAQNGGTEFSVGKSAYAGMILGYQLIGESAVHSSYTFTTSFAVPDSAMNVKFVAPPSGAVEITVQFGMDGTSGRYNSIGLSDNATYNSLGNSYEMALNFTDETDQNTMQHIWVVTGLTPGTAYQYWMGIKSTHASGSIRWGGTAAGRYQDFIMKAVALPAATTDYAVYD